MWMSDQLGLANNPLECVCDLRWLYKRLQPYNETFRYSAIRWTCADTQRWFNTLVDTDFARCDGDSWAGSTTSECENLIPSTTPPAVIYPADPRLELVVTERTRNSVTVQWSVAVELDVVEQVVTRRQLYSDEKVRLRLAAALRRHVLTGLQPNVTYEVCVELTAGNGTSDIDPIVSCCPATTSFPGGSSSTWASTELILGIWVGGGLAAVVIVSVAVYCCCAARRRRQRPVSSSAPRPSGQTKRFRKQGANMATSPPTSGERTSSQYSATQADVDRAIVESVERLDPESKEVLANLLRSASAASLDHIGGSSYYPSPPSTGGYLPAGATGRPTSSDGRNFYEELPDDTYDQIPTDEFV